jgi:outer membrane biosynthesis protein TonB
MGRAVISALGPLAAAAAGAFAPAFASEANITVIAKVAPSQSYGDTLDLTTTRGFGLVTISDKPPPLADYTILDLINLSTPWPIEEEVAQAEASAPVTPTVPIAKPDEEEVAQAEASAPVTPTVPIAKPKPKHNPKPKPKPELKSTKPKPQKQPSWLTADWWRSLTSLRIR